MSSEIKAKHFHEWNESAFENDEKLTLEPTTNYTQKKERDQCTRTKYTTFLQGFSLLVTKKIPSNHQQKKNTKYGKR